MGTVFLGIYLLVVPWLIGTIVNGSFIKEKNVQITSVYIWGHIILWALFWCMCILAAILNASFVALSTVYSLTVLVLLVFWGYKYGNQVLKDIRYALKECLPTTVIDFSVFLMILIQTLIVVVAVTYIGEDDATYIATSADAIFYNSIAKIRPYTGIQGTGLLKLSLTSWNYYISYLGKISGMHVSIVAHTILPAILIPLSYMVYGLIGKEIFKEKRKVSWFMFWINLLMIFGCYSWYTSSLRLTICIWHGKAVMAVIVLPFLFWYLMKIKVFMVKETILIIFIMMAACSMSLMGVGLSVLMVVIAYLINFDENFRRKNYLIWSAVGLFLALAFYYIDSISYWHYFEIETIKIVFERTLTMVKDTWHRYWNDSPMIFLYFICLVLLMTKKDKSVAENYLRKYIILFYSIFLNPIFFYFAYVFCRGSSVYVRVMYCAFVELYIAYILTNISEWKKGETKTKILTIILAITIVVCGNGYLNVGNFKRAENIYKLPQEVIYLCDAIVSNCEDPYIVADRGIVNYIRQYSPQIKMLYGRTGGYKYNGVELKDLILNRAITIEEIWAIVDENECTHIIWEKDDINIDIIKELGGVVVDVTEEYILIDAQNR